MLFHKVKIVMQIQVVTVFYLLAVISSQQSCKAITEIPNIVQGTNIIYHITIDSLELMIEQQQHHMQYNYPTFIFTSQPHIALTISKFEWKWFSNVNYDIHAFIDHTNGALNIQFTYDEMKWRMLRLDFLLFQRADMVAGVLQFQSISQYSHAKKKLALSNPLETGGQSYVLFTSILSMAAHSIRDTFEVNTLAQILNRNQFSVSVQTGASTQIKSMKISYFLFEPQTNSLQVHHFGIFQTKFNHRQTVEIPLKDIEIYPIKYSMLGLSALRLLGPTQQESLSFSIHISQNPTDILRITSSSNRLDYSRVEYLFIGYNMMMACINCPSSYIFDNKDNSQPQCIDEPQCPQVSYSNYQKMYFTCRSCLQAQHMKILTRTDRDNGKYCGCSDGFVPDQSTGRCVQPIRTNSLKQCPSRYQIRSSATKKCECMPNFLRDEFQMCVGQCTAKNSYWDSDFSACRCFSGYEIKSIGKGCQMIQNKCGSNQVYINNSCECDVNTVWDPKFQNCVFCQPGTYKTGEGNKCMPCGSSCLECITLNFCIKCNSGYIFKDYQCLQICGDGKKMNKIDRYCDDGNIQNGDGCSDTCRIQYGYICEGGSQISQDICYLSQQLIDVTKQNTKPAKFINQSGSITYKKAEQSTQMQIKQQNYGLKLNRKALLYINSGIIVDLQILPAQERTQDQINKMFEISVSDDQCYPQSIYLSQDQTNLKNVRCYLHYNHQLPIIDFTLTIKANFGNNITKSLSLYTNTLINAVTSAIGLNDQQSYIL